MMAEEKEIYVTKDLVSCSCEPPGDHPLVYIRVPKGQTVPCGYCNVKFIRKNDG